MTEYKLELKHINHKACPDCGAKIDRIKCDQYGEEVHFACGFWFDWSNRSSKPGEPTRMGECPANKANQDKAAERVEKAKKVLNFWNELFKDEKVEGFHNPAEKLVSFIDEQKRKAHGDRW